MESDIDRAEKLGLLRLVAEGERRRAEFYAMVVEGIGKAVATFALTDPAEGLRRIERMLQAAEELERQWRKTQAEMDQASREAQKAERDVERALEEFERQVRRDLGLEEE
jgi:hypothetical protein